MMGQVKTLRDSATSENVCSRFRKMSVDACSTQHNRFNVKTKICTIHKASSGSM